MAHFKRDMESFIEQKDDNLLTVHFMTTEATIYLPLVLRAILFFNHTRRRIYFQCIYWLTEMHTKAKNTWQNPVWKLYRYHPLSSERAVMYYCGYTIDTYIYRFLWTTVVSCAGWHIYIVCSLIHSGLHCTAKSRYFCVWNVHLCLVVRDHRARLLVTCYI